MPFSKTKLHVHSSAHCSYSSVIEFWQSNVLWETTQCDLIHMTKAKKMHMSSFRIHTLLKVTEYVYTCTSILEHLYICRFILNDKKTWHYPRHVVFLKENEKKHNIINNYTTSQTFEMRNRTTIFKYITFTQYITCDY